MPATTDVRHPRALYQPRLPLDASPVRPAGRVPAVAPVDRKSTAPRRPRAAEGRSRAEPVRAPRRSSPSGADGAWRLDEKTRRAGRQGVAAARAALAGAAGPENGRQAHAA